MIICLALPPEQVLTLARDQHSEEHQMRLFKQLVDMTHYVSLHPSI